MVIIHKLKKCGFKSGNKCLIASKSFAEHSEKSIDVLLILNLEFHNRL